MTADVHINCFINVYYFREKPKIKILLFQRETKNKNFMKETNTKFCKETKTKIAGGKHKFWKEIKIKTLEGNKIKSFRRQVSHSKNGLCK